jgi:hypothetical protein
MLLLKVLQLATADAALFQEVRIFIQHLKKTIDFV